MKAGLLAVLDVIVDNDDLNIGMVSFGTTNTNVVNLEPRDYPNVKQAVENMAFP
jgi:hypothetical protein